MITNMATCWRTKLSNGKILCFTDLDQNLIYEDEVYICGASFTPNSIISSNELAQDNFTISGIADGEFICKKDFMKGEFANAYLEVFLVDLDNLDKKRIILKTGWLGEIKYSNNHFSISVSSLSSKTNNLLGKCYSSSCRAEFGDQYCTKDKNEYSFEGKVTAVSTNNSFIDSNRKEPDDYFTKGIITFLSGENKNTQYNISAFIDNKIIIDSLLDLTIEIGDKYKLVAGCDHSIKTCIDKFDNAINFRGELYIPSRHKLLACN